MGCPVQRKSRYTETGADAGAVNSEWTSVAKCRVLETVGDSGIGEASLGGVVELALPIAGAACVGGVEGVPAGHLTDSCRERRVSSGLSCQDMRGRQVRIGCRRCRVKSRAAAGCLCVRRRSEQSSAYNNPTGCGLIGLIDRVWTKIESRNTPGA